MNSVGAIWLQFILCAALIGVAGHQLSRYGDVIAQRTGMSGSWVGLALLAAVTSLPELATGISSVTVANAPNLAVGDALGSCVVNLVSLVVIDAIYRKEPLWHRDGQGHGLEQVVCRQSVWAVFQAYRARAARHVLGQPGPGRHVFAQHLRALPVW